MTYSFVIIVIIGTMKKQYLLILLITIFSFASCKWSEIDPDVETPSVSLRLSESSPSTEVIISWNRCNDAQGYGITRTFTRDGVTEECIYGYISADTTSFIDKDCEPGTEYTYKVTAGYFKGRGLFYGRVFGDLLEATSAEKTIKTEKNSFVVLEHPKNLQVELIPGKTNSLELSWDACAGADSYEIYRQNLLEDSTGNYTLIKTVTSNKCEIAHLYNKSEYTFKIKAKSKDEKSSVLSIAKSGIVPEAANTDRKNAFVLENGVLERFDTDKDELWFSITPQKGLIKLDCGGLNGKCLSLCDENGEFIVKSLNFEQIEGISYCSIPEDVFTKGEKYLLQFWYPGFVEITVE